MKKIKYLLYSFAMVSTITYFLYTIVSSRNEVNQLSLIISTSLMSLFAIIFVIIGMKNMDSKTNKYVLAGCLLLSVYSIFNLLVNTNILNLPKNNAVISFTNKAITDVMEWGNANKIKIEQLYENSDNIKTYNVISQSIEPGTLVKNIESISVIVSNGPSLEKEVMIPSFIGWKFDDVMDFIDKNYLSNVNINFEINSATKDTIIAQEGSGYLRRNELVKLVFSFGSGDEITPVNVIDFYNKSEFYATTWLKRFGFKYTITEEFSDKINKGFVISQSNTNEILDPKVNEINLVVSKGKSIEVVDLYKMKMESITEWIVSNNLKVSFTDKYDDTIEVGYVISSNYNKGEKILEGTMISLIISKGQLKMPKITDIGSFKEWANKYGVNYEEIYEFNDKENGTLIKASHNEGDVIKLNDVIMLYISQGEAVSIPNYNGWGKRDIENSCNKLGIKCNFTYGGYTENIERDIAINQSKTSGSNIVKGTSISITLSSGKYVKVTVPNYVGMSKNDVSNSCNSLGINCNFSYQDSYSSVNRDEVVSQSTSGIMNKGSSINIVLSKGNAKSFSICIQTEWISNDPNVTKRSLQDRLTSEKFPDIKFNYEFVLVNTNAGAGLIQTASDLHLGCGNTVIQGNSYTIRIGTYSN